MAASTQTHFGFRDVPTEEKASLVKDVFARVASRYDTMNDVMSLGMHRLWKREMVAALAPHPGQHILDLAGGTGDIAFRILEKAPGAKLTVCDINEAMLSQGKSRAIDLNYLDGLEWVVGDAQSLPFPTNNYDACTMAFGIRNVTDIPAALRSIHRVIKPGGRFLCLEFSRVSIEALEPVYDAYSFKLIPQMGEWIAKDRDAYQYLVESIRKFPDQRRFASMLKDAGFAQVNYRNMAAGVVALHSGYKI